MGHFQTNNHTTSKEQDNNKRLKNFLMAISENGANLKVLMDDMSPLEKVKMNAFALSGRNETG
ncbi:MAG: hypothetical protein J6W75_11670 [Bacteroidaceae bacterium]|nr:hypothetical protein [Bacteroidaceae bacterium]